MTMRNSIRRFQDSLPSGYSYKPTKRRKTSPRALACMNCCGVCTCCVIVLFVLLAIVLGISKLAIGVIYFHNCPLEPKLPIFLIVSALIPFSFGGCQACQSNEKLYFYGRICVAFIQTAWLIAGTVFYAMAQNDCQSTPVVVPTVSTTETTLMQHLTTPVIPTTPADLMAPGPSGPGGNAGDTGTKCLTCNETLLEFTLTAIIIDWIFMTLTGCVYGGICILNL